MANTHIPKRSALVLSGLVLLVTPELALAHGISPVFLLYFAWFAVYPFLLALHLAKSKRSFLKYQLPVAVLGILYFFAAGAVFGLAPGWFPVVAFVVPMILKLLDNWFAKKAEQSASG